MLRNLKNNQTPQDKKSEANGFRFTFLIDFIL